MNEIQPSSSFHSVPRGIPAEPAMTAHDLALIAWRRLWLIALIVAVSTLTAAILSKRSPKAWQATAQVLLVQRQPMMIASGATQAADSAPMVESIETQITLLQSRELARLAAAKLGISPETLQGATTITPNKEGDNVLAVSVVAGSRQHAIDWAETLCKTFVAYKDALAQQDSKRNLARLEIQTAQAKKQAADADAKLLAFQQTHRLGGVGVLDPQTQKTAALNALAAQNAVVAGLQNDTVAAQATAAADLAQLQQGKAAIAKTHTVRDDSQVFKLQASLSDLERKRFDIAQRYYGNQTYGKVLLAPLDGQIADTQARLTQAIQALSQPSLQDQGALQAASDNAQSAARAAQVKLAGAIAQRSLLQQQTLDLPRLSQEAQNLIDSQTQAHSLYNAASAAVQAAQINKNVASGNVQIVQDAFAPAAPFRPNPKHDLLVGFGIGLVLALLAVLLLEQTDSSVRTAADVRRLVDGPVVAVLPQMTRAEKSQFSGGGRPPHLIETYNAARANLSLAMRQRAGVNLDDHQIILVTSALPGEGKSLTASELAQSFARAGRRVALVNADMRRPSSLMQAGKTSPPGLAEVLCGEISVEEALLPTETENLSVLQGGNATQNPMDLISQPHMAEAMQALRAAADVVIVDSPPAAVVADALLLAPHVDCILYVIGVGMVDSENMRNTAGALAAAAPKMLAYFVNRVPRLLGDSTSYSYAGYGRTTFAAPSPGPEKSPRVYRSTRTIVMKRPSNPDAAGAAVLEPDSGSGSPISRNDADGARSSLRILPRIGSSLFAFEGPYAGQSFALSSSKPLTLGSRPDSDIVLARDATISQVHARIGREDEGFVVYDISSTNGTLVNDAAVSRHALEVGDVLQLGASKFRYE